MPQRYKLSPSDLTYLYEGCKCCFVLKVKHGIGQPSMPLPGIFATIASLQEAYFSGKRTETFCPALPPGGITHGEQKVQSKEIVLPSCESTCYIKGRFDIVAAFDNGSYGVMDFKTAKPGEEKTAMYGRQLQAYALALENAEDGYLALSPVTRMGLFYFSPEEYRPLDMTQQMLKGPMQWVEVVRDDEKFLEFLSEVVGVLEGPMPAPNLAHCSWCQYRHQIRALSGEAPAGEGLRPEAASARVCPVCSSPMRLKKGKFGEFWSCQRYPDCRGSLKA